MKKKAVRYSATIRFTLDTTVPGEDYTEREFEVEVVDAVISNSGIGAYEFWGQRCVERGHDYAEDWRIAVITDTATGLKLKDEEFNEFKSKLEDTDGFAEAVDDAILQAADNTVSDPY